MFQHYQYFQNSGYEPSLLLPLLQLAEFTRPIFFFIEEVHQRALNLQLNEVFT